VLSFFCGAGHCRTPALLLALWTVHLHTHLALLCDFDQSLVCQLPSCLPGGLHECPPVALGAQLHTASHSSHSSHINHSVDSSASSRDALLSANNSADGMVMMCIQHVASGRVPCINHGLLLTQGSLISMVAGLRW
jgi:hypothetical protein